MIERVVQGITNFDTLQVENLYSTASSTFTGTTTVTTALYNNGLGEVVVTGSCNDASTTLFAVINPFKATSTWDLAQLYVSGAASSGPIGITVATSTNTGAASSTGSGGSVRFPGWGLIYAATVPIGEHGYIRSGLTFGTSTAQNSAFLGPNYPRGSAISSGTTTSGVVIGPEEYIVGHASGTGVSSIVPSANGFACEYKLRFSL